MPLPDQPQFAALLQSLTLTRPEKAEEWSQEQIVPPSPAGDENGIFMEPGCSVWYRPCEGLTFDGLVRRVEKELTTQRHKADQSLARCVIGMFVLHPERRHNPVGVFNRLTSTIADADLSQFFVAPVPCQGKIHPFTLGEFTIGPANLSRIEHRTKKAGSHDFFARWHHQLSDRFTVERNVVPCRAIGIPTLRDEIIKHISWSQEARRVWERCATYYFHALAISYAQDFWDALLSDQHLLIAAGAPYLDERVIRRLTPGQMISVFRNIAGGGFVAPIGQDFQVLEVAGVDTRIPKVIAELREQFGFAAYNETDVHHTLRTFALFLSKARRHELDGRMGEAFLHHIIALDLLFGEKDSATVSVSRRTAIIVHTALDITLGAAQKMINQLYDTRSKYVHRGIEMPNEEIAKAANVCREVLFALLRFQHDAKQSKTINGWLKNLDYLNSAIDAGKPIAMDELSALGIATTPSILDGHQGR
jgi:hypothetical protein